MTVDALVLYALGVCGVVFVVVLVLERARARRRRTLQRDTDEIVARSQLYPSDRKRGTHVHGNDDLPEVARAEVRRTRSSESRPHD
jgi:hypothetical protein